MIRVFDPQSGAVLRTIGSLATVGRPMGLTFKADGNLYVNDWGGSLRLIDPNNGNLLQTLASNIGTNQWNRLAPDGSLLVDNYAARTLDRYDASTGAFLGMFATLPGQLEKFIFMPQPIPEPATAGLGVICGGWLIFHRRHRRQRGWCRPPRS